MDHARITAEDIPLRYFRGQLSEADTDAFVEHYLRCDDCLAELEALERFETALRGVALEDRAAAGSLAEGPLAEGPLAEGPLAAATLAGAAPKQAEATPAVAAAAAPRPGLRSRVRHGPTRVLAIAAALVIAGLCLALFETRARIHDLSTQLASATAPVANPLLVELSPLRSASTSADPSSVIVQLEAADRWVTLVLDVTGLVDATNDPSSPAGSGLVATFLDAEGATSARIDGLAADPRGRLVLSLSTRGLAGPQRLEVQAIGEPGQASPATLRFFLEWRPAEGSPWRD